MQSRQFDLETCSPQIFFGKTSNKYIQTHTHTHRTNTLTQQRLRLQYTDTFVMIFADRTDLHVYA